MDIQEETDKNTNDFQARHFVARDLERYVRCIETQRREKSGLSRNQNSTMPEDCVVFTSLILMMRFSIKDIMKNARRKLEIPLPAAMLCKLQRDKYRENCWAVGQNNTKYVCIDEANDSMRIRMEGSRLKNHEDHTAGKRMNSLSHYNMVLKFTPMPQAFEIPDAKAAVEK